MKIKTQEVKKNILKSLKLNNDKAIDEKKFVNDEAEDDEDDDENELDSDQEVNIKHINFYSKFSKKKNFLAINYLKLFYKHKKCFFIIYIIFWQFG